MGASASDPFYAEYEAAMREHGGKRIELVLTVFELTCIVGLVQLAVQDERLQSRTRGTTATLGRTFVDQVERDLSYLCPTFRTIVQKGWWRR